MSSPPLPEDQKDKDHMQLLSIFHYVCAGLGLLMLGGLFFHYYVFSSILDSGIVDVKSIKGPDGEMKPVPVDPKKAMNAAMGFMMIFYWIMGLLGIAMVVSNFLSARWITARKNRMFSLVVAGFNCLSVPLGTILGVFTFIVLLRPTVERSYRE